MQERAKATGPEKGPSWNTQRYAVGRGGKGANRGGNTFWQKGNGKKGGEGTENGGKEDSRTCWCGNAGRIAAWCPAGGNRNLCAVGEKESEVSEEAADNEAELQLWCLWEESEHEQWQEVIRRKDKQTLNKAAHVSLLGEGKQSILDFQEHNWSAGEIGEGVRHFGRDATPKKFVAANGEQIRDLEQKTISFKTNKRHHRCINFRSASVVRPLISNAQSRPSWKHCGAG